MKSASDATTFAYVNREVTRFMHPQSHGTAKLASGFDPGVSGSSSVELRGCTRGIATTCDDGEDVGFARRAEKAQDVQFAPTPLFSGVNPEARVARACEVGTVIRRTALLTLMALVLAPAVARADANDPAIDWHLDSAASIT